jgi:hypothetical protein
MYRHTVPGIIPIVMGGLGNQMFIVAAGYVASSENNIPVYMIKNTIDRNKHNHNKHDYNESIFKHIGVHIPFVHGSPEFFDLCKGNGYRVYSADGFQPWSPSQIYPGTLMMSYYQFYPPLAAHEHELRTLFLKGIQKYHEYLVEAHDFTNAAFLHIRRGDYLDYADIHLPQSIDGYYKKAVNRLLDRKLSLNQIYVISDDMVWVKEQDYFKDSIFTFFESKDELETLAMMSLCTSGAICANSTFSWWGAFLGAYGARSPVIVPERWISDTVGQIISLFPEEWIRI